ncbi:MAG: tetratricopeptide repeat protein [Polyangiales bacterium]
MQRLSSELLGLAPDEVAAGAGKQVFARALAERCVRDDLHEALADAIVLSDREAEPRLRPVYEGRAADDLLLAPSSRASRCSRRPTTRASAAYLASNGEGHQVHIKLLREGRARDRRGLHRFLLAQRALRNVDSPAVQRILAAGTLADGRPYVAAEHIDGQLLSARLARAGAMHVNEAKGVLQAVCEGLDKVHAAGLAHADLRTDHVVLVRRDGGLSGVLVDFGIDRLGGARHGALDAASFLVLMGSAKGLAPERIRTGAPADARSDVYALGALTYEVLTGKAPFADAASIADQVVAHMTREPEAPSKVAPRGWVSKDLDAVVLKAMAKEPEERFATAGEFFRALMEAAKGKKAEVSAEEFAARKAALAESPADDEKALALESAGGAGATWPDVAAALREVADGASDASAKKALLFRAARVLEAEVKDLAAARGVYESIAAMEGGDDLAAARAKEIRRVTATPEERAELLLEEIDAESLATEKARLFVELGRLYERDLKDNENAVVALTEAITASPADDDIAGEIERLVGDDTAKWGEVLSSISEAIKEREAAEQVPLYKRAGRWYLERVKRQDFALACFTQVIGLQPGDDEALEAAAGIYRKQAQWPELVGALLKRADAATAPAKARDARADAADVLESKLNETSRSREMLEEVLAEDPGHELAARVYERLLVRSEDWAGIVKLLERRADAVEGEARAEALCEVAETYEDRLSDVSKAAECFERAREADPRSLHALKGLERLYARQGNHEGLLKVLQAQVEVAATPRQKVELWGRIGAMQEEEFVDREKAAAAFEAVLAIDPANDGALRGLGRLYRVLGRWEELATLLERHASQLPDDPAKQAELYLSAGKVLLDPIGAPERAARCFSRVLEVDKANAAALEGMAKVAALQGDARAAAEAYDQLAAGAATPAEKVEVLLRAGKLLEEKGDRDGAIDRYKQALDADPDSVAATARLRELYAARGDAQGAVELLQREIEAAEGTSGRRCGPRWPHRARDRLKDKTRAQDAAEKAVLLDATNEDASALLGEMKFEAGDFAEAAKLLAGRAGRVKELGAAGVPLALMYGEALARSGERATALEAFKSAREAAPDDRGALLSVAKAAASAEAWGEARTYFDELLRTHGKELDRAEKVDALATYAEALLKGGDVSAAVKALHEAHAVDADDERVIALAVEAHGAEGRWDEVARFKRRQVEIADSDAKKLALHIELGDLVATKLGDKAKAARSYVSALEMRPDDRRILMKLMQLYSEEKDWGRLVEIILRFTDLVEDRPQLGRYYLTAGQLCEVHLGRPDEAVDYYVQALEHDPSLTLAIEGLASVKGARKDWSGLEQSYRKVLAKLPEGASDAQRADLYAKLGELNEAHLKNPAEAISAYERARELDPTNDALTEKLASLYTTDSKKYFDRAVEAQRAVLAKNPMRVESLHALRRVFTEAKRPDEAWCMCQALVSVKGAEPEEESFWKKFRTEGPAAAQEKLNEERWRADLAHPTQDPLLTSVFATILPAVLKARAVGLGDYGLSSKDLIDPAKDEGQMAQTIHYAAGVLGLKTPTVYVKPSDDSGVSFALTDPPSLYLGSTALAGGPSKALAFIAGTRLAYFRQGHIVRQLVPTGTGLRAWLFAAIRAVNPSFPVSAELQAPVADALASVKQHITGAALESLTSLVQKLLAGDASLDLKRWTAGVDLTADRAGFVLSNDLVMASAVIRATPEDGQSLPHADRLRELRAYAISEEYLRLRKRLGLAMVVQSNG